MKKDTKILGLSVTAFIVLAVIIFIVWKFYPRAKQTAQNLVKKDDKSNSSNTSVKPVSNNLVSSNSVNTSANVSGDENIKNLQKSLNSTKLYNLKEDGILGTQTRTALYKEIQKMIGTTPDGIFGTQSKAEFQKKYGIEPTDSNLIAIYSGSNVAATAAQNFSNSFFSFLI